MKNQTCHQLKNKEMSPAIYQLRRKVIALIYEAKKLVPSLPRINVRVTDNHTRVLGVARMGACEIWITEKMVANRYTVFHEILHAAYGVKHVKGCKLMSPTHNWLTTDAEVDALFIKYATGNRPKG